METWRFAFASVIGNSHIAENIPCQDYCDVQHGDGYTISVVCDGAGSCSHSDTGARHTVQSCIFRFDKEVKTNKWHTAGALPDALVWGKIAKQTLGLVKEDLENYSIENDLPFKSLACTVIVVITLDRGLLVTHIGDGRAGYMDAKGAWHPLIRPFHGAEANETVFITSDIWTEDIINDYVSAGVVDDEVTAFCLLSDGCERAAFECNLYDPEKELFYDPNRPFPLFFSSNIAVIPRLFAQGNTQDEVNKSWKDFLTSGNETLRMESDDKTLILGVRVSELN